MDDIILTRDSVMRLKAAVIKSILKDYNKADGAEQKERYKRELFNPRFLGMWDMTMEEAEYIFELNRRLHDR